jgi:hypothetical protein
MSAREPLTNVSFTLAVMAPGGWWKSRPISWRTLQVSSFLWRLHRIRSPRGRRRTPSCIVGRCGSGSAEVVSALLGMPFGGEETLSVPDTKVRDHAPPAR